MTLRRLTPIVLLAALAGCSMSSLELGQDGPSYPAGSPQRACQDYANADTSLNQYAAERAAPNGENTYQALLARGRRDAFNRCLVQRGLMPQGGVERVK